MTPRSVLVRALAGVVLAAMLASAQAGPARAAPTALYGVQDDAWLLHGPGALDERLAELQRMGVDAVRFTVRWNEVAARRPSSPRDHRDPAYEWKATDAVLEGLRRHRIAAVVTLLGTPGWANGGRAPNWAPTSRQAFGSFAYAAARRYPWVRRWTVWNEPNRPQWLRPTSARTYVRKLLNPAYAQIHAVAPGSLVGGGMSAPRAGSGGVSPVAWIAALGRLGARLDAYAHHPYPGRPQTETPWLPACARCAGITMADLERLIALVRRTFGPKRIWLTEYGYQTNPPDTLLGVPPRTQASRVASAMRRVYEAPGVDLLVFFLVRDDAHDAGWQSGFVTTSGVPKPAYTALRFPLVAVSRKGGLVTLWGQVRPRGGPQPYRLRMLRGGRWSWLGGVRVTDARGTLRVAVRAPTGSVIALYSVRDRAYGLRLRV